MFGPLSRSSVRCTIALLLAIAIAAALPIASGQGTGKYVKIDPDPAWVQKFVDSFSVPIRVCESKPVTVGDATFVLAVEGDWRPPRPDHSFPMVTWIDLQYRISNRSSGDRLFADLDRLKLKLLDPAGKEVKVRTEAGPKAATMTIVLAKDTTYAHPGRLALRSPDKDQRCELVYANGLGEQFIYGPIGAGKHKLIASYAAAKVEPKEPKSDAAAWTGEAVLEVAVDVLAEQTRGNLRESRSKNVGRIDPFRLVESKPMVKKDARLVLVTQDKWRIRRGEVFPIPIVLQPQLTNLGKKDVLFPTFDTLNVILSDARGKRVQPTGGRNWTRLTRPILIPGGSTYAIEHDGDLRIATLEWDFKTKATNLVYRDGTGSWLIYGPLHPGRYKLAFDYCVGASGPAGTDRGPLAWTGHLSTPEVDVELIESDS